MTQSDHLEIQNEIELASGRELHAYLIGAAHDGVISKLHKTLRISQGDTRWLNVLRHVFAVLGTRSWIYREGKRRVWVIESCFKLTHLEMPWDGATAAAFARGYFDAEGGVPRRMEDRLYIQFVQKDRDDLETVKRALHTVGVASGATQNPSQRVAPDYWRFYVRSHSHLTCEQGRLLAPSEAADPGEEASKFVPPVSSSMVRSDVPTGLVIAECVPLVGRNNGSGLP